MVKLFGDIVRNQVPHQLGLIKWGQVGIFLWDERTHAIVNFVFLDFQNVNCEIKGGSLDFDIGVAFDTCLPGAVKGSISSLDIQTCTEERENIEEVQGTLDLFEAVDKSGILQQILESSFSFERFLVSSSVLYFNSIVLLNELFNILLELVWSHILQGVGSLLGLTSDGTQTNDFGSLELIKQAQVPPILNLFHGLNITCYFPTSSKDLKV